METKDVYICYNGADLDWVRKLAEQMESETIDGLESSRRLTVFFDKWDIAPGQSLIDQMNRGMLASRHVVTILSPEFLKAEWPRFEWKHIVAQNPNNVGERIIPLMLRDLSKDGKERIELCAPFRDLRYVDFRKESEFKRGFNELIRRVRNLPPERGRRLTPIANQPVLPVTQPAEVAWLPDRTPELLLSNLLAVTQLPLRVWGGSTTFRKNAEVRQAIEKPEPFILRDGKLFTFVKLDSEKSAIAKAVNPKTVRGESCYDWLLHDDRRNWMMALLNTCLGTHLRWKRIVKDDKGRYFFLPNEDGSDRTKSMKGGKPRTVAAKKGDAAKESIFWVHYAARMRFRRLGQNLFLSVDPVFLFTTDGTAAVKGKNAGRLSLQWGGKQQNPDILRDLLFWTSVLADSKQKITIYTGGRPILVDAMPATTKMENGVAYDTIKIRSLMEQADTVLSEIANSGEVDDNDPESNEDSDSDEK